MVRASAERTRRVLSPVFQASPVSLSLKVSSLSMLSVHSWCSFSIFHHYSLLIMRVYRDGVAPRLATPIFRVIATNTKSPVDI